MNFQILYTLQHEKHAITHKTEWICPYGYTIEQALQSFKRQFPSAAVVQIRPLTELPAPDTTAGR